MNYTSSNVPEAFISVMKNRQKIVNTNEVYLDNRTEFQIEFFNPTSQTVLANIFINGSSISNKGLVLKPGQRVWLDRYLDDNRKFLFETYEVSGNSQEVKNAIANNGKIRIEFHPEKIKNPPYIYSGGTTTINWPYYNPTFTTCTSGNPINLTGNANAAYFSGDISCSSSDISGSCYASNTSSLGNTLSFMNQDQERSRSFAKSKKTIDSTVETGRVEKGSTSNQSFETVNTEFEWWTNAIIEYKLLPISTKNVEAGELNRFCSNCGAKRKENYKFCPTCGNRF
jgi:hypothetical protein